MLYDFDTPINRWQTDSEKYDGLKKFAPDAPDGSIPLWIADMDFKTAPVVIEAMHRRVDQGIFGYTDLYNDDYRRSVCSWMKKRHGWHIAPEEIVVDSGVVPALSHGLSLAARPGDGVIIHTPAYKPFYNSILKSGMVPVFSPLRFEQGRYEIDFQDLELKAMDTHNTVLILCSPHNPTGRVWTEDELTQIMDICRKHGLFLICDEIHNDILRPGIRHIPMAKLFPDEKHLITCTAPSKTFNLAGNHLSNIIIPDKDIREQWNTQFHYLPNPISVAGATAAYEAGAPWLDELNQYLEETFRMMEKFFHENLPDMGFYIPEATYLAWIHMGCTGEDYRQAVKCFIDSGLIIESGEQFVSDGDGFIRMNVAMPHSVIETVLTKIKYIFN